MYILKEQKASKYSGGIYYKTQIDLTHNSNHMERSRLTHDQTRYIFETNIIDKNINIIQGEIVAFFADTGNTASGYRKPDSIENEVRQGIIYVRFLPNWQ